MTKTLNADTDKFRQERQLEQLYRQAELALLASLVCAAMLGFFVSDTVALEDLVRWGQIMGAVGVIRYLLIYAFRHTQVTPHNLFFWYGSFVATLALSGAAWGSSTFFLSPTANGVDQVLLMLFVAGFIAGAGAAFAGDRLAFAAFAFPAVSMPLYNLMIHGDSVAQKIAFVFVFFLVFLLASSERAYQSRKSEIEMQLERQRLDAELQEEKENLKELAVEMEARVKVRTQQLSDLNEKLQAEVFERREAEQAAKSQKIRFTAAFESAPVGMLIAYQATGEIIKANAAVCQLLGYGNQELTKMRLASLLCPSERENGAASELFANDSTAERRFIHRRGHVVHGRTSIGTMSGDEFTDGYVVIQIQDQTALVSAQDKLTSRDGALGTMFDSTPLPTAIIDSCGRITEMNPRMTTLMAAAYGSVDEIALATLLDETEHSSTKLADFFSGRVSHVETPAILTVDTDDNIPIYVTVARVGNANREHAFAVLHIEISAADVARLEKRKTNNVVPLERRA